MDPGASLSGATARDVGVVLPAAGLGARFGGKKAFVDLAGRPLLFHSLRAFARVEDIAEIVVVVRAEDVPEASARLEDWREELSAAVAPRSPPRMAAVLGGKRRQDSVERGILALGAGVRWVLVHDAARPLVQSVDIQKVLAAVRRDGAAVLGHPATDSVKEERDGLILGDLPRARSWLVQTPQGASFDLFSRAYAEARRSGRDATDEAGLLAAAGVAPRLVEGSRWNLKITFPEDLAVAEAILRILARSP